MTGRKKLNSTLRPVIPTGAGAGAPATAKWRACPERSRRGPAFFPAPQTSLFNPHRATAAHCTLFAAVTIALLDSARRSGCEYSFAPKCRRNFFTQPKKLCYYAGLILLQKFFLLLAAAHLTSDSFRSKIGDSSYFVERQF
jgi:hypothetical protein